MTDQLPFTAIVETIEGLAAFLQDVAVKARELAASGGEPPASHLRELRGSVQAVGLGLRQTALDLHNAVEACEALSEVEPEKPDEPSGGFIMMR